MAVDQKKFVVEIWSDIMCPFCYIGKEKFDRALSAFPGKGQVKVVWKSFQLMPHLKTEHDITIHQMLAREKGISLQQAQQMNGHVFNLGHEVGLKFNFDQAVVANTFTAHRLLHFAKTKGLQHEAEGRLFKAFFTEGKNIDDIPTLINIGAELGLDTEELTQVLNSDTFTNEVLADMEEARQLGVTGVPFFVLDRKYAVSGAQPVDTFRSALERAHTEWLATGTTSIETLGDGAACTPGGTCN